MKRAFSSRRFIRQGLFVVATLVALAGLQHSTAPADASYYPVFTAPFNGSKTKDFSLVKKGDLWYIVSINDPVPWPPLDQPEGPGLPVSTSYDLEHWTYRGVAIPTGITGEWDDRAIWAPSIVESNGTYYLYYAGVHVENGTLVQKIGLATSTDLINWTKYPSNPVFDCSTLSWNHWDLSDTANGAACRDPYVIHDDVNNQWVMFFSASLPYINQYPYWSINNPGVVGIATSSDLIHWNDAGFIPATEGFTTESPHVFEHNGTWYLAYTGNCTFQNTTKCLIYSTASSLMGPYSGYSDLPGVYNYSFASEYIPRPDGSAIFGDVELGTTRFYDVDWSSGSFNVLPKPTALLRVKVWDDSNGNGVVDTGEAGINGVAVDAYLDNGDGVFSATDDFLVTSSTTKNSGILGSGLSNFNYMQKGLTWLVVRPTNLDPGGVLEGKTLSTDSSILSYNVTTTETVTGLNIGYAPPDTTPPSAVSDLHTE